MLVINRHYSESVKKASKKVQAFDASQLTKLDQLAAIYNRILSFKKSRDAAYSIRTYIEGMLTVAHKENKKTMQFLLKELELVKHDKNKDLVFHLRSTVDRIIDAELIDFNKKMERYL